MEKGSENVAIAENGNASEKSKKIIILFAVLVFAISIGLIVMFYIAITGPKVTPVPNKQSPVAIKINKTLNIMKTKCDEVSGEDKQNCIDSYWNAKAFVGDNLSTCDRISNSSSEESCANDLINKFVINKKPIKVCDNASDVGNCKNKFYYYSAISSDNETGCDKIANETIKKECVGKFSEMEEEEAKEKLK